MHPRRRFFILLASLPSIGPIAQAQVSHATFPAPPPRTKGTVGQFDAGIVQRAAEILASASQWNRTDTGSCPRAATTYSIRCALKRAVVEGVGMTWDAKPAAQAARQPPERVDCSMDVAEEHRGGSCGTLWDEAPVFILSRANAITSGVWRADVRPREVWAGTMADAESPVNYEAPRVVELISTRKYSARLIEFNNDSAITFKDVQAFFRALEDRVLSAGAADLDQATDGVEIEIYAEGTGLIRTYNGWYPVSGFVAQGSTLRFQIDTAHQVAPSALDREILQRASTIMTADSVWNRADDRKCAPAAATWSIYCAVEKAEVEVTGGFHHRRPAMELVREIVDERTKGKSYQHRLMDYNNDQATHLDDVRSLFAEAIARIR
jgi:hypothetical protein